VIAPWPALHAGSGDCLSLFCKECPFTAQVRGWWEAMLVEAGKKLWTFKKIQKKIMDVHKKDKSN
jgi:hypothetical protein